MPELTAEAYQELRKKILSTLRGAYVDRIAFSLGSYRVTGQMFRKVADLIESDQIMLLYSPNMKGRAEYDSVYDILWIGFTELKWTSYGLLIHECLHAAMDANGWDVNVTTSEALAYIAQALYTQMAFGRNLEGKPFHVAADSIAQTIAYRGTPTSAQVIALRDALLADPKYSKSLNARAQFNGINGMWRVLGGQLGDLIKQYRAA